MSLIVHIGDNGGGSSSESSITDRSTGRLNLMAISSIGETSSLYSSTFKSSGQETRQELCLEPGKWDRPPVECELYKSLALRASTSSLTSSLSRVESSYQGYVTDSSSGSVTHEDPPPFTDDLEAERVEQLHLTRLDRDLEDLSHLELEDINWKIDEEEPELVHFELCAGPGSPFEGQIFKLIVRICKDFPLFPPEVRFVTPIDRTRIRPVTGRVDLPELRKKWLPHITLAEIIVLIKRMIDDTNFDPYKRADKRQKRRQNKRKQAQKNAK